MMFVNCQLDFNDTAFDLNHGIGTIFDRIQEHL